MAEDRHDKARLQTHKQQDDAVDHINDEREGAHGDAARTRATARLTDGTVHQGKRTHGQQERHNAHRHGSGQVIKQAAAKTAHDGTGRVAREHA
ncbi:hypothetical protein COLAER_02147 [Collinsella aerofaciens ATCC 25986]|uniref:Uncharacterized protein n=1 Tax=Collinsella aerofaciens (strain ATCC 25986 / DSM 3979 / JCM 10188 / KCTC 3647 / NCTC 11838 / VPI 1003) TaxID=411903 RepID=A4ECG4_COLAA|nr:hypothetical protein COLAER_02147 [Collinsella aerofaciens ATCC 25986]